MKIIIPDIHGQIAPLETMLGHLTQEGLLTPGALIFTGDYGDRGDHSREVHLLVKSLTDSGTATALLGNHEEMLMNTVGENRYLYDAEGLWRSNGGKATIESYGGVWPHRDGWLRKIMDDGVLDWLKGLPIFYEDDDLWCSHAPVACDGDKSRESILWNSPIREFHDPKAHEAGYAADLGKRQVVGHIPSLVYKIVTPRVYPHIIYADTGGWCLKNPTLSAIVMEGSVYKGYYTAGAQGTVFTEA